MCHPSKITIIGAGYVGLISACSLAQLGSIVTCVDCNQEKIELLTHGIVPLYEPELKEIITLNTQENRLFFSTDIDASIRDADIIIVTVGTPMNVAGQPDLYALNSVISTIGNNLINYKVVCIKSTVPPGTNEAIKHTLKQCCKHENFDVVSNPEFLREGSALSDFFQKNPIVLGSDSDKALQIMETLYKSLIDSGRTLIKTNFITAELIKYAWNAFSAIKISYVNELAQLCNKVNANIADLAFGASFSDDLLPIRSIKPGPGIGGSCLPKDTRAFVSFATQCGIDLEILKSAIQSDIHHQEDILANFYQLIDNDLKGKTVAILGLSFKANTDDIRCSPAITVIENLLSKEAHIKVYDPQAMEHMKKLFPMITYCYNAYHTVQDADVLVLLTDWDEFKTLDLTCVANLMKQRRVMDLRNIWRPHALECAGFIYKNLGRM